MALPLVRGGDHDWNERFYRVGLLAPTVARRLRRVEPLLAWRPGLSALFDV